MNSNDKIVEHLTKQRAQSQNSAGTCLYRSEEGLMCAAGCLIPDQLYNPGLERHTVNLLRSKGHYAELFPDDISFEELKHWQRYHDSNTELEVGNIWGYAAWLGGDLSQSPAEFRNALAKYIGAGVTNA